MKLPKITDKDLLNISQTNLDSGNSLRQRFNWNHQSIRWFLASEDTTNFYQKVLETIHPYIENLSSILDIGCGIGGFSIAFAKSGFYVTAIDSSMIAMEHLRNKIQEINLQNIKIFPVSLEDFQFFQKYDVIFGSYIMGLMEEKMIDRVLEYTTHYLILLLPYRRIKNDFCIEELYRELKIDTDYLKQSNYLDLIKILDRKNISYHIKILHSDFGQPFQTKEEGLDFINHYFPILKKYDDEVMKWLDRKCILRDGKYYLPNQKESVIMIIEKKGRI